MKDEVLERIAAWTRSQDWDCGPYITEGKLMYILEGSRSEMDKIYLMISAVADYEDLQARIDYLKPTGARIEVTK